MKVKVVSLYDGIGCGRVALEREGIEVERYVAFENDKYAMKVSKSNFPDIEQRGEITASTDFSEFEGFDMVIGGSPCTYWSIAKKDRETTSDGIGFELFMHFVRAVKQTRCKWFIYENNHSIHRDIKSEITKALGVDFIMINSALVSAQQRKRCYWTNITNITQPDDKGIIIADILESGIGVNLNVSGNKSKTLLKSYSNANSTNVLRGGSYVGSGVAEPIRLDGNTKAPQSQRIYSVRGKSVCINAGGGGAGAKTGLYRIDLPDGDYIIRKLTPIEAERLQTLPDNYTHAVSNSQRYKGIGNGWTVDVITHILKHINYE